MNLKDANGWTPLHYAANEYFPEVTEFLLNNEAKVNATDDYGNNVLWRAVFASKGRGEIIHLLLAHNANQDQKNDSGISLLELAETIDNYDVKQFFL